MEKIKPFKVLRIFESKSMGTTTEYHQLVECPDCKHQFIQDVSSGCFHHRKTPNSCPKCNYPWSKLVWNKEENKSEVWNPSKRLVPYVRKSVEEL